MEMLAALLSAGRAVPACHLEVLAFSVSQPGKNLANDVSEALGWLQLTAEWALCCAKAKAQGGLPPEPWPLAQSPEHAGLRQCGVQGMKAISGSPGSLSCGPAHAAGMACHLSS